MESTLIVTLLILLALHHFGDIAFPLAKGIIISFFDLLEFAIERCVTFRERLAEARRRWREAG